MNAPRTKLKAYDPNQIFYLGDLCLDARTIIAWRDELALQRAENARLREALEAICVGQDVSGPIGSRAHYTAEECRTIARLALKKVRE